VQAVLEAVLEAALAAPAVLQATQAVLAVLQATQAVVHAMAQAQVDSPTTQTKLWMPRASLIHLFQHTIGSG
jgi:hypothetical protein